MSLQRCPSCSALCCTTMFNGRVRHRGVPGARHVCDECDNGYVEGTRMIPYFSTSERVHTVTTKTTTFHFEPEQVMQLLAASIDRDPKQATFKWEGDGRILVSFTETVEKKEAKP